MARDGSGERGGIPDGLLVGLLAFLLGLAVLVWTATGLAALFARGSWPSTVTFMNTPDAVRSLIKQPHDMAAAWPATDPADLSNWGLFWGIFLSELLVLFVLTVFAIGVVARTKARRARARMERAMDPAAADGLPPRQAPKSAPGRGRRRTDRIPAAAPAGRQGAADPVRAPADGLPARADAADGLPAGSLPDEDPDRFWAWAEEQDPTRHPDEPLPRIPEPHGRAPGRAPGPAHVRQPGPDPLRKQHAARDDLVSAPVPAAATGLRYGSPAERLPMAAQRIGEAEGAVLVVTSSPALWAETKDARAKLGPVLLYDPSHLCDTPARMHWHPGTGCTDRDTAAARAAALLAPVRPQARIDAAVADTAETLLRSWLHAAALDDRPFKQVHRWAQGGSAHEPVRILRTHPKAAPGLAGEFENALTAHPERREIAQELTARALSCLSSIHIREACNPNRTDSLTLASFMDEGGTLYVVGEPIEDPRTRPGAMPLLTALTASVVEHGRRMAARSSDGRLDPPVTLVLDDVAAVAPLPDLPRLLSDAPLPLLALCRSREQARTRWPEADLPPA
ncbi:type VI secretion protein [Streptomyces bambusae]|uniref:type VI secretion protein n=1 Tax=Streptomyces bambusae TaxID=1550616 RepID=UPI001CFE763C|nr:type VI secretion protein [Streptomyces bambusae]MCB5166241.1 type VI secretion protein [Streptomyces bambusae]